MREFTVAGGLVKNALLMQIYSDVLRRPLHVVDSEEGPALGSAIHAAVAAGCHEDVRAASAAMGKVRRNRYLPDAGAADRYDELYGHYTALHDHFGRRSPMMHELRGPPGTPAPRAGRRRCGAPRRGRPAARGVRPLRARELDERQPLRPRARARS